LECSDVNFFACYAIFVPPLITKEPLLYVSHHNVKAIGARILLHIFLAATLQDTIDCVYFFL